MTTKAKEIDVFDPERRLLRDSNTSGIKGEAEVWGLRLKRR
jgi:hypothetical protein